jgi:hypothetical protein
MPHLEHERNYEESFLIGGSHDVGGEATGQLKT